MTTAELLSQIPRVSFSETFNDHEKALLRSGVVQSQISEKRSVYRSFFQFDEAAGKAKSYFEQNPNVELNDYEFRRFGFLFDQLKSITSALNQLNFVNSTDLNSVFERFQTYIT